MFRRVKDHHSLLHCSPLLKKTCVRQVVLDKRLHPELARSFCRPRTLAGRSASSRARSRLFSRRGRSPRPPPPPPRQRPSWPPARRRRRRRRPPRHHRRRRRRHLVRSLREMGGASRNPAPRSHFLVWIVKPSGCHCTDALVETNNYLRVRT